MSNFLDVYGLDVEYYSASSVHKKFKSLMKKPRDLSNYEWQKLLKGSFKFVFVRHPFVRLVSAFQNKVIDDRRYKNWFGLLNSPEYRQPDNRFDPETPILSEFVNMILSEPGAMNDVHIQPYWKRCDFCRVHYDVIGKTETFQDDMKYILERNSK